MKFVLLFLLTAFSIHLRSQDFNILTYGAKPDNSTINTKAIQAAIDACNNAGGGTVVIPHGTFLSGTIILKSHVHLRVDKGAVLKGSSQLSDYTINEKNYGLIYAEDAEDITISGYGEINGNSSSFMDYNIRHSFVDYDVLMTRQGKDYMNNYSGIGDGPVGHKKRPDMMIIIKHSSNITIRDLYLTDSPNWTTRIGECENVIISGLKIINDRLIPNNDGIHCTTSRNVSISDCVISCGDDGIIVTGFGDETGVGGYTEKAGTDNYKFGNKTKISENVTVTNCVIASSSAGIRIGYGMNNIRNCIFSNIVIHESNRGILVQCRDDMTIEHIKFSNIVIDTRLFAGVWWGKAEPIHVSAVPQRGTKKTGRIRDISFNDISVTHAESGVIVYGLDSSSTIEDISFRNIRLTIGRGANSETFGGNMDMRPAADLKIALAKQDISAFYFHHVKNLLLENVEVNWENAVPTYFSGALTMDNFSAVKINRFTGRQAGKNGNTMEFTNGRNLSISNCTAAPGADLFLYSKSVTDFKYFINNDLIQSSFNKTQLTALPALVKTGNILKN